MPHASVMRRAREAARGEWQVVVRRNTWRGRLRIGITATAAVLSAIGVWFWMRPGTLPSHAEIATFQRISGTVVVTGVGTGRRTVTAAGEPLKEGDRIELGDGSRASV